MCVLDHTGRTETEVPTCQSFISNASPRTAQLLDTGTPSPKFGVAGVTLPGSGLVLLLKRAKSIEVLFFLSIGFGSFLLFVSED